MKIMISFLSFVIIISGAIHFLGDGFPVPHKGTSYSIVLILLGVLLLASSFLNNLLLGFERFVIVLQAIAIIAIALLPVMPTFLTFIPREGFMYAGSIIIVGLVGLIYGIIGMG